MAELLKNIYNEGFFDKFLVSLQQVYPSFDSKSFLKQVYNKDWEQKELKERMRHITIVMNAHLHVDFQKNAQLILELLPVLEKNGFPPDNLEFTFLADLIEVYGMEDVQTSLDTFEVLTQFVSCEFAIRPFIIADQNLTLKRMLSWSKHKNHKVRRLASEGCRPRLPWAMALPKLKVDPAPILPILENLKADDSEYVRRSVANNLNDISKTIQKS